jgi:hypothetical protein
MANTQLRLNDPKNRACQEMKYFPGFKVSPWKPWPDARSEGCPTKGIIMRRLYFSLLALSFVGVMMGCCHHIAGVCDCDHDPDPCQVGCCHGTSALPVETHSTSAPLPEIRETLPTSSPKLITK